MTAFAMAMLVCSDLARSRAFYRDVLALRIGTDASPQWIDFELTDGQRLGDNVDAFIADARTAGVRVLQDPYDQTFGRVAVIADPDGYAIQVFSPKHAGAASY